MQGDDQWRALNQTDERVAEIRSFAESLYVLLECGQHDKVRPRVSSIEKARLQATGDERLNARV